jgi:hypothetical protein
LHWCLVLAESQSESLHILAEQFEQCARDDELVWCYFAAIDLVLHRLNEPGQRLAVEALSNFVVEVGGGVFPVRSFKMLCKLVELVVSKGFVSLDKVLNFMFF